MIRNVLEGINGAWIFQTFALVLFTAFFTGVCVWAMRLRKSHVDRMGALPLCDDNPSNDHGD